MQALALATGVLSCSIVPVFLDFEVASFSLNSSGPLNASPTIACKVLDEINLAPSDLLQRIQGLIERSNLPQDPQVSASFRSLDLFGQCSGDLL